MAQKAPKIDQNFIEEHPLTGAIMSPPFAELIVPGNHHATLQFCAHHFIKICQASIADHGFFAVALSGGSTPRAIYELLSSPPFSLQIEWDKIYLFWSDERAVPPTDPESNYHMAMKAGFEKMLIPPFHIHRMVAEKHLAKEYEATIRKILAGRSFDLVMLGIGEDGHTASLFPGTDALKASEYLVVNNYVPEKKCWRMTLTLEAINDAANAVFYVLGPSKAKIVSHAFHSEPHLPCQLIGTPDHPALWIVDEDAALKT